VTLQRQAIGDIGAAANCADEIAFSDELGKGGKHRAS
jgi:hypothetical protein